MLRSVKLLNQSNPVPTTIIQPSRGFLSLKLGELWQYRELVYFLTWRDVKVRYKQAVLGFLWAFIQPFLKMVVFSVVFGGLAKMDSEGFPYPIFLYLRRPSTLAILCGCGQPERTEHRCRC